MAEIVFQRRDVTLYNGDCLQVLRAMEDCSVDSIVTDPPAGIGFMGKTWDEYTREQFIEFLSCVMKECLRVLKPGGHAVVWSIPRTSHWTGTALEDAGFEIRDVVLHLFGSGFPKSLDVSKAIDKAAGAEREVVGTKLGRPGMAKDGSNQRSGFDSAFGGNATGALSTDITAPATDAAKQWNGWGTALKPAAEFWWLCRKPLEGTVAANVQKWGTGAPHIDLCRVETTDNLNGGAYSAERQTSKSEWVQHGGTIHNSTGQEYVQPVGRWPANVTHDGSEEVLAEFPHTESGSAGADGHKRNAREPVGVYGGGCGLFQEAGPGGELYGDSGSAARFFYCAKASSSERGRRNDHPTVKPIDLMRWLCRLVTPPDGVVLDCFAGSGSTLVAAREEGFRTIGIERESHYCEIIKQRMAQDVMF